MSEKNTTRIQREMQEADKIRESMRQGMMGRVEGYMRTWLGNEGYEKSGRMYERGQAAFQESGLRGAFSDIYRRLVEQGWFGKDVFDGRHHWDTKGQEPEKDRSNDRGNDLGL